MKLKVITPPTVEPVSISEVMAHLRLDASNMEPAPSAPTVALVNPAEAGNVDNGVHRYLVTFVTADGETEAGIASAAVQVVDKTVSGKVLVSGIQVGGNQVVSRKIYRTVAGGSTYLLVGTLANNTDTTYTDDVADASLGAGAPTSNTTLEPLLAMFIEAARQSAELQLHRYLCTQTVDAYFDEYPENDTFALPPLQSVTSFKYIDTDGVEQTLAANQYEVDNTQGFAEIYPAYDVTWPTTRDKRNAIVIRFVAGYGAAADVPACIKDWMLFQINSMWETRTQFTISFGRAALSQIPNNEFIDRKLDPERVWGMPT